MNYPYIVMKGAARPNIRKGEMMQDEEVHNRLDATRWLIAAACWGIIAAAAVLIVYGIIQGVMWLCG